MSEQENKYKTQDFYLAAFFDMHGREFEIESTGHGNKKNFVFDDFLDRDVLIKTFYTSDIIQKYITSIQKVKREMYDNEEPVIFDKEE